MSNKLDSIRILLIASLVVALLFFGNYVFEVSAETKNAGPLKIDYAGSGPLFSATNIAPGYDETKALIITNQGTIPHSFAIAVSGTLGDLAQVLHIKPYVLGSPVWDKTIIEITTAPDSNTIIGAIAPGGTAIVDLKAYLPDSVGNDYQGTTTLAFNFIVGDQEPEPTVTILPSSSASSVGIGGGTIFGGTKLVQGVTVALGASTSPPPSISPTASPSGEVGGDEDNEEQIEAGISNYKYLYWLVPILLILLILFFLWWRRRRKNENGEDFQEEEF